jgi:hypothetical protein
MRALRFTEVVVSAAIVRLAIVRLGVVVESLVE